MDSPHGHPERYSSGRSSGRHKRTPSGSAFVFNQESNEDFWQSSPPSYSMPVTGRSTRRQPQPPSMSSNEIERPNTLELPLTPRTPLRSSLKKNSSYPVYQNVNPSNRWSGAGGGGTSSGGTPTNPTPPDSISEEGRNDSTTPANRVRFSPSPFEPASHGGGQVVMQTDWSPTHVQPSRNRPHHFITESDLQRDFNIYP